jgi:hypothetical protein
MTANDGFKQALRETNIFIASHLGAKMAVVMRSPRICKAQGVTKRRYHAFLSSKINVPSPDKDQ